MLSNFDIDELVKKMEIKNFKDVFIKTNKKKLNLIQVIY